MIGYNTDLAQAPTGLAGVYIFQTLALFLTAGGLGLTALKIRKDTKTATASRQAGLAWAMYLSYTDSQIRAARGNVEGLAHSAQCPRLPAEYKQTVADNAPWDHFNDDTLDMHMRRLLRFYNQIAVLLRQKLIDPDFVFGLIGAGLETAWPAMKPAIQYYQRYYSGVSGTELAAEPRPIYNEVAMLQTSYIEWKTHQELTR